MKYEIRYLGFIAPDGIKLDFCPGMVYETDKDSYEYVIAINTLCTRIRQYHAPSHQLAHIFLNHHHQPEKHIMQREAEANLVA